MSKYLNPNNDVVFYKIFGKHKHLLISFLNAMLEFEDGKVIVGIEYLKEELTPETPLKRRSIVNARCTDSGGRQFIVEILVEWIHNILTCMFLNTALIYGSQRNKADKYTDLQPVYSLVILNCVFYSKKDEYYHQFVMQNPDNTDENIDRMHITIIELPKFTPQSHNEKEMSVLWLRFLKEIDGETNSVSPELTASSEISEAIEICERATYAQGEINAYRKFWDFVWYEESLVHTGKLIGEAKRRAEGEAKGKAEIVINLAAKGFDIEQIAELTGLPVETVKEILLSIH